MRLWKAKGARMNLSIRQFAITFFITLTLFLLSKNSFAAGVEDLLVDLSDYLSSRLIPTATAVGVGVGGIMAGLGSPKGVEVVKYSVIGGVIGTAGAETISALFF